MANQLKMRQPVRTRRRGFTLVEMVTVMAVIGIVAAMVAVFLKRPMQEYQDAQRRADISDTADTAFMRLKRDLQTALPNSVRVTSVGQVYYLEFLQTRSGGRYRAAAPAPAVATSANTCADTNGNTFADENVLQFGVADNCFTTLGPLPDFAAIVPGSDSVVVYNLGAGFTNADAYSASATNNRSIVTAIAAGAGGENVVQIQSHSFTLESPGRRFQIVSGPVSYVCDPGAGTLTRISGYAIAAAQSTPPAGTSVMLAQGIGANGCTIIYTQNVINQRIGVVSVRITFADATSATNVNLYQEIQVSNVP
jgi:MSHA biogenesis protein MshO